MPRIRENGMALVTSTPLIGESKVSLKKTNVSRNLDVLDFSVIITTFTACCILETVQIQDLKCFP